MSDDLNTGYENKTAEVVSYKCPNCGGPLAHDIESQKWGCKFCLSDFTTEELPEVPVGDDAESAAPPEIDSGEEQENQQFTCPSCGGTIITDKNTVATYCIYCQNPTVIAGRLTNDQRPSLIIPFKVTKAAASEKLLAIMSKRPFMPSIFKQRVKEGEFHGLYVPYWLFDATLDSHITGTGKKVTRWEDSDYEYTKTDIYDVVRAGVIRYNGVPADGSQRLEDREMQCIEPFDYGEMKSFDMGYLSGHFAEGYDVGSEDAFGTAYNRMTAATESALISTTDYSSFSTTSRDHKYSDTETRYAMMPVWIYSVKYGEKIYRFLINGQSGKITGNLPVSVGKVFAWIGSLLVGSLFIAAAVMQIAGL